MSDDEEEYDQRDAREAEKDLNAEMVAEDTGVVISNKAPKKKSKEKKIPPRIFTDEILNTIPAYKVSDVTYAEQLIKYGVVVVPLFSDYDCLQWNIILLTMEFPEFKNEFNSIQALHRERLSASMGGFGACNFPSSFHHPIIRELRKIIKKMLAEKIFIDAYPKSKLESLYDRLCIRHPNYSSLPAESWHVDLAESSETSEVNGNKSVPSSDVCYGGWVNFTMNVDIDVDASRLVEMQKGLVQEFRCLPGSHKLNFKSVGGFDKIQNPIDQKALTSREVVIKVPPGHAIVFVQGLLHRVNPMGRNDNTVIKDPPSVRLFHGFRLTNDVNPLYPLPYENGGVPQLPSGQWPPIYPKLYWLNHRMLIDEFCFILKDQVVGLKTTKGIPKGHKEPHTVKCPKYLPFPNTKGKGNDAEVIFQSLSQLGLMSQDFVYSAEDIQVLYPQSWESLGLVTDPQGPKRTRTNGTWIEYIESLSM